jgi:hypothetical protein
VGALVRALVNALPCEEGNGLQEMDSRKKGTNSRNRPIMKNSIFDHHNDEAFCVPDVCTRQNKQFKAHRWLFIRNNKAPHQQQIVCPLDTT